MNTWVTIPEFPAYEANQDGDIRTVATGKMRKPTLNTTGVAQMVFRRDGRSYTRAVAKIIADIFLDPPKYPTFDTPVNLDGDRLNNAVENLVLRPRWHAVKYFRMMEVGIMEDPRKIRNMSTGKVHRTVEDVVTTYGVLDSDIWESIRKRNPLFPTNYYFTWVG